MRYSWLTNIFLPIPLTFCEQTQLDFFHSSNWTVAEDEYESQQSNKNASKERKSCYSDYRFVRLQVTRLAVAIISSCQGHIRGIIEGRPGRWRVRTFPHSPLPFQNEKKAIEERVYCRSETIVCEPSDTRKAGELSSGDS